MKRFEHGGDVWHGNPNEWMDFSSNINALGCPDFVQQAMRQAMEDVSFYPQVNMDRAINGLGKMLGMQQECILPTNGGIAALDLVITKLNPTRVVVVSPSFVEYERIAAVNGIEFINISMMRSRNEIAFPIQELKDKLCAGDMLILCNPSNPTGYGIERQAMKQVLDLTAERGALLLVDEAFVDFCEDLSIRDLVSQYANLIIAGSLTKMFAVPGVRLGYLLGQRDMAAKLKAFQSPWVLSAFANSVAQSAGQSQAFIQKTLCGTNRAREKFKAALEDLGAFVFESCANYLLVDLKPFATTAAELAVALKPHRILLRNCENYRGLDEYYTRLAVKSENDNQILIDILTEILKGKK